MILNVWFPTLKHLNLRLYDMYNHDFKKQKIYDYKTKTFMTIKHVQFWLWNTGIYNFET